MKAGLTHQRKPTDNEGQAPQTHSRKAGGNSGAARIKP